MKLVINTQYRENYGDETNPRWKSKGGDVYVVEYLSEKNIQSINDNGIPNLSKLIEYSNPMSSETIIAYSIVDDNATICEEWESPIVMSYFNNTWVAKKTDKNDGCFRSCIKAKTSVWEMLPNNERANFIAMYEMADGSNLTYQQLEEYVKNQN